MDEHERIVIDEPAKIYFAKLLDKGETSHLLVDSSGDVVWVQVQAQQSTIEGRETYHSSENFPVVGKGVIEI